MALTIGNVANIDTGASLLKGQAQASYMGLDKKSGNALGLTDLLKKDDDKGLVGNLIKPVTKQTKKLGGSSMGALSKSSSRLRGTGLKNDLMSIGGALKANAMSDGLATAAKGTLLNKVV